MPNIYTEEFKRDVVITALNSSETKIKIAKDFGISESVLHKWIKLFGNQNNIKNSKDNSKDKELVLSLQAYPIT